MELINKLKNIYDKKDLKQVEAEIGKNYNLSMQARRDLIFGLIWIQHVKLFREDPVYKNASFQTYLLDRWNIVLGRFEREYKAFVAFEEFTLQMGAGLTSKIIEKCGDVETPTVIREIERAQAKVKQPLKREQIERIIQKHAKPRAEKKIIAMPDWQTKYEKEMELRIHWQESYEELKAKYDKLVEAYQKYFQEAAN